MQVTQTQWMASALTSAKPMASTEAELATWSGCLSACSPPVIQAAQDLIFKVV